MPEPAAASALPDRPSVKQFFETVPPGKNTLVNALSRRTNGPGPNRPMHTPAIELHCDTDSCQGVRFFEPNDREFVTPKVRREHFLTSY